MEGDAAQQVAAFTGLDTESVKSQIIPYLESLKDASSTRHHLQDLVGPGAAQATFIDRYVKGRFPTHSASSSAGLPHPVKYQEQRATKAASSSKVDSRRLDPPRSSQLSGNAGQATQTARPSEEGPAASRDSLQSHRPGGVERTNDNQRTGADYKLVASDEMKTLDAEIIELTTTTGDGTSVQSGDRRKTQIGRTCFCQGRKHPLFTRRPICFNCGFLQCSLNVPSPFVPDATCGSCDKALLPASERSSLLATMVAEREEAERRAQMQAEQVRRERERVRAERAKDGSGASTVDVFPELAGGDAEARRRQHNIAVAMGRKTAPANTTGSLGPRGGGKQHRVLTIGKKGKVTVGSTTRKVKPVASSTAKGQDLALKAEGLGTDQDGGVADEDELLREEEETRRQLGIVADSDDDALQSHADSLTDLGTPDLPVSRDTMSHRPSLTYVLPDERRRFEVDEQGDESVHEASDGERQARKPRVPGAAVKV
ncbi:unnamed protein product [Parajaminaea phylloscopi]